MEHVADIIGSMETKSVLMCAWLSLAISFAGARVTGINVSVDALRMNSSVEHFEAYTRDWVERSLAGHTALCFLCSPTPCHGTERHRRDGRREAR